MKIPKTNKIGMNQIYLWTRPKKKKKIKENQKKSQQRQALSLLSYSIIYDLNYDLYCS